MAPERIERQLAAALQLAPPPPAAPGGGAALARARCDAAQHTALLGANFHRLPQVRAAGMPGHA